MLFLQYITKTREYDYCAMREDLKGLSERYPFLRLDSIGSSVLGRSLPVLAWGEGDYRVLLCGAHHGKEWITSLLLMRFAEILCSGLASEEGEGMFSDLAKTATYFIIPMINPDGVGLSIHGISRDFPDALRARLICANGGSEDFIAKWQANARGVDLNHNYDAAFERGRAFAMRLGICGPGPTRWSGAKPESEPESRALVRFTKEFLPDVCVAYHSQGEVIYADFEGKATKRARRIAREMSRISGYELDETEGVESCSGYKDWVINELYLPAYTVEVGHGENPLPLAQFEEIMEKNLKMLLFLGRSAEI